jgi:hypothetical protein
MQKKNTEMLAAQSRLDQAAEQLVQLQAALGGVHNQRRGNGHAGGGGGVDGVMDEDIGDSDAAAAWQRRAEAAEARICGLTTDLDEARSQQLLLQQQQQQQTAQVLVLRDGAGSPSSSGRSFPAHAAFRSTGDGGDASLLSSSPQLDRTEFPKLWEAAGKKASQDFLLLQQSAAAAGGAGAGGGGGDDDDQTTRGLATIVEGLRMRRMQLLEQKQHLFSPTNNSGGGGGGGGGFGGGGGGSLRSGDFAPGLAAAAAAAAFPPSRVPHAVSFGDDGGASAAQREEWRRNLRSRGGVA